MIRRLATPSEAAKTGGRRVGVIPDDALWPQGGRCATTVFYRRLA